MSLLLLRGTFGAVISGTNSKDDKIKTNEERIQSFANNFTQSLKLLAEIILCSLASVCWFICI